MIKQFAERTAGTGLIENVQVTCDPDNPTLRPSDEQVDELLRIANQYVPKSIDYFEYQRAAIREWLAKIGC